MRNIKKIVAGKTRLGMIFPFLNITFKNPFYLLLHITMKCNRSCKYCYQQDSFYGQEEMSLETFEDILRQRSEMFIKPYVHLFGGEPLFYKDLNKLWELLIKYKVKFSLTTNGDLIGDKMMFLSSIFLRQINISLNKPFGKNLKDHLLELLENILVLKKVNPKLCINLNYNLNPDDYDFLKEVYCFFKENAPKGLIDVFVVQHYMHPQISATYKFDCGKIKNDIEFVLTEEALFDVRVLPEVKDIKSYYTTDDFISHKCYVPFLGLSIFSDGRVAAGGGVFGCNVVLGNILKETIKDIWQGHVFKEFRKRIRKKLPKSCSRCCQKLYA